MGGCSSQSTPFPMSLVISLTKSFFPSCTCLPYTNFVIDYLGGCSYLVDNSVFSVDHYIVNSSSHFTVVIRCEADNNNYESYTVGCGRNGEWEMDITSVCHDPYSSTGLCKLSL